MRFWRQLPSILFLILIQVGSPSAQEPVRSPESQELGRSWDPAYLEGKPGFNIKPNAFLVEVVRKVRPGDALDVGMGQGRNALFLAKQGWNVTGFDVSEVAVAQTREQARKSGLTVNCILQSSDEFNWGKDRWDLIVVIYFPQMRGSLQKIIDSLRPGGLVVLEAYHKAAALDRPPGPGPGVTFDNNELIKLFAPLRILQYQDVRGRADWGLFDTRLVRLLAQKHP
ncbi:MAG TPA: class I SAM-dependent methyltransferase [Terriglobia bacterium]|nr:class I SAM-dependent methyltransferase [Terriglobia bacterium]